MQPTLPIGFDSWAEVLTDWQVRRAFVAAGSPRCLSDRPELAAPFVCEISRLIRERQLHERPREAAFQRAALEEPAYEGIGGADYLSVRTAMEAAQEHYIRRRGDGAARAEMELHQADFYTCRGRHRQAVEQRQATGVREYWDRNPGRGLPDDFFATNSFDFIPARMSRIEPAWWWRSFFQKLQSAFAGFHAADGRFLDELPAMRARAKKKKLAAEIAEWCLAHSESWGWDGPGHYRMLANRAGAKASEQLDWLNRIAPGCSETSAVRESLHARLAEHLALLDPWARYCAGHPDQRSEHWRN